MNFPSRFFEVLALSGYFLASLIALASQLSPRAGRQRQALGISMTAFVLHSLLLSALLMQSLGGERLVVDLKMVFLALGWGLYALTTLLTGWRRQRLQALQASAYPLCALIFLIAVMQPEDAAFTATGGAHQVWFAAHLIGLIGGVTLLGAAAIFSVLYLLEDRRLRAPAAQPPGALPPLETSDRLGNRSTQWGFAALSLGIFAGLTLQRESAPARPLLDFVTITTLLLWGLTLLALLARVSSSLSGRRSAWLHLAAALLAVLTLGFLKWH